MTPILAAIGETFIALIKRAAIIVGILAIGFTLLGMATGIYQIVTGA